VLRTQQTWRIHLGTGNGLSACPVQTGRHLGGSYRKNLV